MRLPSMTMPVPLISRGDCLVQGLGRSGLRTEENTFTTEFSTRPPAGSGLAVSLLVSWARTAPGVEIRAARSRPADTPRMRMESCILLMGDWIFSGKGSRGGRRVETQGNPRSPQVQSPHY